MNAAIYVRVSTDKQEAEGYSLGTQEAACRKYAAEQGYAVSEVYREVHTASELYERPELARCREAMARGEYAALICYDPDRFSRNQVHTALLQDFCERAGVALKFALFDFEQSATGRFLLNARAFAAELELEKIKERTMRGKRARAESGKLLPGCRALFGYRYIPDRTAYAIDPETAPIVRRIFADVASGVTLRALSAALSDEGVPTASGRAEFWHPSTVRWVATNPAYTGEATAWRFTVRKDRQRGTATVVLRPASEQVALPVGTVPPLVDADTFLAVQERLRLNKARAMCNNRNPQAALLRAGFARCGYCGRALAAETAPQGVRYGCGGGRTDAGPCKHGMLAHLLDSAVWERIEALLTKPETVARQLADLHTADPTSGDAATVDRALAAVARQQANLGRTVALLDDEDAAAPLVAELRALGGRKRQLEQEREVLGRRREEWAAARAQIDTLTAWCAMVAVNLREFTYDEKRLALEALGVQVRLWRADHEPRYEITASIPLDGKIVTKTSFSSSSPRRSPEPASGRSPSTRARATSSRSLTRGSSASAPIRCRRCRSSRSSARPPGR